MDQRLTAIRTISHRLFIALVVLVIVFIAGAFVAYYFTPSDGRVVVPTPLMAFFVGVIGGFVGLQRRLKQLSQDDLTLLEHSWVYIFLSPLVGGILSVLLYILFISELLSGELFPKFEPDASSKYGEGLGIIFAVHGKAATDYAKLIVWCFLAGFSERFVVDIISQFESRVTDSPQN